MNSKIEYIKEHIESFQFKDYLQKFDFRDREFAEDDFKKTINSIISSNLLSPRIINFCQKIKGENYEIFNHAIVLDYWEQILYAKLINSSRSVELMKRDKELHINKKRKISERSTIEAPITHVLFNQIDNDSLDVNGIRLKMNSCLDISNDSQKSIYHYVNQETKNRYTAEELKLHKLDKSFMKDMKKIIKSLSTSGWEGAKNNFLEKACKTPPFSSQLFMTFYKIFDCKSTCSDMYNYEKMIKCSEADFINFVWCPIIVELFKNSDLHLRWGDTNLNNSNSPFRVDLRVAAIVNDKEYDVGVAEFARFFKSDKAKNDRAKLILESKELLNIIYTITSKKRDPKIAVYGLQVAGLKGHIISTSIKEDKLYMSYNTTHRMRFPTRQDKIYEDGIYIVKTIMKFKENCINLKTLLESSLKKVDNERNSFVAVLNDKSPKKKSTKKATTATLSSSLPDFCSPLWLEKDYKDENRSL